MAERDLITREIVQHALAATADEMAVALYRTAYSPIVRDCLDYSTSLCNAAGEMIAQGVTIPLHLGAVPTAMETLFAKFGEEMAPGDIYNLERPLRGGHAHPRHLRGQTDLLAGSGPRLRRQHRSPPRPGRAGAGQLGHRQHRDLSGGPAPPLAQALRQGRAQPGDLRHHPRQRAGAAHDAGRPQRPAGRLPHRRARRPRALSNATAPTPSRPTRPT